MTSISPIAALRMCGTLNPHDEQVLEDVASIELIGVQLLMDGRELPIHEITSKRGKSFAYVIVDGTVHVIDRDSLEGRECESLS